MKYSFLWAVLFFALPVFSQINVKDSTVQVIAYWDKGEAQQYAIINKKVKIKGSDTTVVFKRDYKVDIRVIDSVAKGYTISWKYRDVKLTGTDNKVFKFPFYDNLEFIFTTDENGSFKELKNWKQIRDRNAAFFKKELNSKDPEIQKLFKSLAKSFSSKEAIENYTIKEIKIFTTFHGIALELGKPIESEMEEDNPLSQKKIKSDIHLELAEIDFEEESYVIKFLQTFDGSTIKELVEEVTSQFTDTSAKGGITEALQAFEMEDYCGAMMHNTGWPIAIQTDRTVHAGELEQIESWTITLE
ncbi:MAG: hypothetical protein ACO1N9_02690 [Flavobacterium sp.]